MHFVCILTSMQGFYLSNGQEKGRADPFKSLQSRTGGKVTRPETVGAIAVREKIIAFDGPLNIICWSFVVVAYWFGLGMLLVVGFQQFHAGRIGRFSCFKTVLLLLYYSALDSFVVLANGIILWGRVKDIDGIVLGTKHGRNVIVIFFL